MNTEELIARYFQNTLSPEAQKRFDHLMATDPDFVKQVEFQKNLQIVIKKEQQDQVKATLQAYEFDTAHPSKNYKFLWIAASIIALIVVPSFIYFGQENPNHDDLFSTYFKPYENIIAPISRSNEENNTTVSAFLSYDRENYLEASKQFEDLYASENTSHFIFYQAICEIELNNPQKAIELLKRHKKFKDKLSNQTNWYLALAYLSIGDLEETKLLLKLVIDKKQYNYKMADDLLDSLD